MLGLPLVESYNSWRAQIWSRLLRVRFRPITEDLSFFTFAGLDSFSLIFFLDKLLILFGSNKSLSSCCAASWALELRYSISASSRLVLYLLLRLISNTPLCSSLLFMSAANSFTTFSTWVESAVCFVSRFLEGESVLSLDDLLVLDFEAAFSFELVLLCLLTLRDSFEFSCLNSTNF